MATNETISEAGRLYLHWALTDGVGPIRFQNLMDRFGSPEAALAATAADLAETPRVGRESAERIVRSRASVSVDTEIAACQEFGVQILCSADADYPPGLRQIPDRPIVLYVRGELRATDAIAVAIVGSRRCSIYGSEQARRFGELLAGAGFTIVSGLARGIDSFAQHGAVDAGGRSIAVLGCGLDHVYPPENQALAEKVLASGAWLSELPIRTAVRAGNFPSRNRIIAGMTLGTLVIEAAATSGALITARLASEYNREVFALPGRAQEATSIGTNALIRDGGAKLVTCLDDVLSGLGDVGRFFEGAVAERTAASQSPPTLTSRNRGTATKSEPAAAAATLFDPAQAAATVEKPLVALNLNETRVLDSITDELLQDQVIAASGLETADVLAALTGLELKGLIRRLPGQRVARRRA